MQPFQSFSRLPILVIINNINIGWGDVVDKTGEASDDDFAEDDDDGFFIFFFIIKDATKPGRFRTNRPLLAVQNQLIPPNRPEKGRRVPRFSLVIPRHRFRRRDVLREELLGDKRYSGVRRRVDSVGRVELSD